MILLQERFGLKLDLIKENGDFVWIPFYIFEFERLIDSDLRNSTTITTSDLNNSISFTQGPQISIPAGYLEIVLISSILTLPLGKY